MPSSSYAEVDARFNYWGEATTAEMNEGGNQRILLAFMTSMMMLRKALSIMGIIYQHR